LKCSHRGGGGEKHENSLSAFQNSIAHEIKYLELDVQLTKDNVVVVAHDYDLSRCHEIDSDKIFIGQYNFDELPHYKS